MSHLSARCLVVSGVLPVLPCPHATAHALAIIVDTASMSRMAAAPVAGAVGGAPAGVGGAPAPAAAAGGGAATGGAGGVLAVAAGAPAAGGGAPAGGLAAALAMVQGLPDAAGDDLVAAETQLRDLQAQRQAVQKDLKNKRKRNATLMRRANGLTDALLMSIVTSRAVAKAKAAAKGAAKAKAKAKGKAVG